VQHEAAESQQIIISTFSNPCDGPNFKNPNRHYRPWRSRSLCHYHYSSGLHITHLHSPIPLRNLSSVSQRSVRILLRLCLQLWKKHLERPIGSPVQLCRRLVLLRSMQRRLAYGVRTGRDYVDGQGRFSDRESFHSDIETSI
jgi:hypothetical protein